MRSLRTFARLCLGEAIPDETTILNFCHLLEASELTEYILKLGNAPLAGKGPLIKKGSNVDATIIAALRTSKNKTNVRAHEMPQTKRGIQWHFGIKEDIAVSLSNPANIEYQVVRTTLLPGLLKTLQHNKSASFSNGFKF